MVFATGEIPIPNALSNYIVTYCVTTILPQADLKISTKSIDY
jgi:hypothetical protein